MDLKCSGASRNKISQTTFDKSNRHGPNSSLGDIYSDYPQSIEDCQYKPFSY